MPEMTGAEAMVGQLCIEDVDTVFALPGVQIMAAFDAIYKFRDQITLFQTRHEQATTFMADGYARASGKVGVAMVVPGPGALNAATGLATAYATSSPVLLISGQIPSGAIGMDRGELHEVNDQLEMFKSITKWNHRVTKAEEIPEAVHEAMKQLQTGRPRPVELEVPSDILSKVTNIKLMDRVRYQQAGGDALAIKQASKILAKARNPIIIAGGGTMIAGASAELLQLAEHLQAPVMTTQQAKGIIPEDHYLAVGVNYYGIGPVYHLAPDSDAILVVGSRLLLNDLQFNGSQKLIQIDADPNVIGKTFDIDVGIEADAKEALTLLIDELCSVVPPADSKKDWISAHKRANHEEIRRLAPDQVAIIETLRESMDENAILVSGITNIGYWSNLAFPIAKPRSYLATSYFATLGFSYPTALGAKVGCPERQVVALCGDGGFMFSPQELSTAMRYGLDVVAVVFNNGAYGASQWDQTHRYNNRHIGTDLHNPDFLKLADAFGVASLRTDVEGLGEAIKISLAAKAPALIEVTIPNMMPPFQVVQ